MLSYSVVLYCTVFFYCIAWYIFCYLMVLHGIFFVCILESMTMQSMAKIETRKKINADCSSETPTRTSDLRRCRGEGVVKERPDPQLYHGMGEGVVFGLQEDSAFGPEPRTHL